MIVHHITRLPLAITFTCDHIRALAQRVEVDAKRDLIMSRSALLGTLVRLKRKWLSFGGERIEGVLECGAEEI